MAYILEGSKSHMQMLRLVVTSHQAGTEIANHLPYSGSVGIRIPSLIPLLRSLVETSQTHRPEFRLDLRGGPQAL